MNGLFSGTSGSHNYVSNGDGTSTRTITYKVPTTAAGVSSFNIQTGGGTKTVAVNVK